MQSDAVSVTSRRGVVWGHFVPLVTRTVSETEQYTPLDEYFVHRVLLPLARLFRSSTRAGLWDVFVLRPPASFAFEHFVGNLARYEFN